MVRFDQSQTTPDIASKAALLRPLDCTASCMCEWIYYMSPKITVTTNTAFTLNTYTNILT